MEITGKFLLRCMRHTFIWAWDASIMYAAYHLQHFLPPILFTLIMAVGDVSSHSTLHASYFFLHVFFATMNCLKTKTD